MSADAVDTGIRWSRKFSTDKYQHASAEKILETYRVVKRGGDKYSAPKEFILVPPDATMEQISKDASLKVAAIVNHRNMIFGARSFRSDLSLSVIGTPLIQASLASAYTDGEQPQAMASLAGLSEWVTSCIDGNDTSETLESLKAVDMEAYKAVQAIATGVPREGHSVVGVGTYRDGESGWKALAKEFLAKYPSDELKLYQSQNAEIVAIEHLADTSADYLKTAGGAMARLFFI